MRRVIRMILVMILLLLPLCSSAEGYFDEAREIANFMETHYGIKILIGPECENLHDLFFTLGTRPRGRTPFQDVLGGKDYVREIQMIDDAFSIYSLDFFDHFACSKFPNGLRVILVDQIIYQDINTIAGTISFSDGYINLFLGVGHFIEKNIHHEIWHAIDYRIEADNPNAFAGWYRLNPEGFHYSEVAFNDMNIWEQAADLDEWFARGYSAVSEYEDRATVFEAYLFKDPEWWAAHPGVARKLGVMMAAAQQVFGDIFDTGEYSRTSFPADTFQVKGRTRHDRRTLQ